MLDGEHVEPRSAPVVSFAAKTTLPAIHEPSFCHQRSLSGLCT